jgi:membrane protein required for beta-lactamase induction
MLAKLIGIVLIVIGGIFAIQILFPLIGSLFGLIFLLVKLAIAVICIGIGYRLIKRED